MGENISINCLLNQRIYSIQVMLENIDNWDGSIEKAFAIIKENRVSMDKITEINEKVNSLEDTPRDEEYLQYLNRLAQSHKILTLALRKEKDSLLKSMEQVMVKKDIVKSYISLPKETIFIDKDL